MPDCGNPYLYWHHFDPPWDVRQHHDPDGMIALCGLHHPKADAGAYSKEQLREFKRRVAERAEEVKGRFEWMRHSLLAVVGGDFYYETPVVFQFRGEPSVWFNRDANGYLLLNVRMLSISRELRVVIEDNFWLKRGNPSELISPPHGRLLQVTYPNGDMLKTEFFELESVAAANERYPEATPENWDVPFPITAVEIHKKVGGTKLEFGPRETTLPGYNVIRNSFMARCSVGIALE